MTGVNFIGLEAAPSGVLQYHPFVETRVSENRQHLHLVYGENGSRDNVIFLPGVRPAAPDPQFEFLQRLPLLAQAAQFARRNQAYSYRKKPFLVGSSLFMFNAALKDYAIVSNGNIKLQAGHDKFCAEMSNLDEMDEMNEALAYLSDRRGIDMGRYEPIGLATVGTDDPEEIRDVTGQTSNTLYKCPPCVDYYVDHGGVPDHVLEVTLTDDLSKMEAHTFGDFKKHKVEQVGSVLGRLSLVRPAVDPEFGAGWDQKTGLYSEQKALMPVREHTPEGLALLVKKVLMHEGQAPSPHPLSPMPDRGLRLAA
jgi:hypothetical protein